MSFRLFVVRAALPSVLRLSGRVPEPLGVTLTRPEIRLQNFRARMLDCQIGYLRVASFSREAPTELTDRINDLLDQQPTAIVLDLRSNPGGFVTSAVEITSQFLNDGVVFYQRGASGEHQEYRTRGPGTHDELSP